MTERKFDGLNSDQIEELRGKVNKIVSETQSDDPSGIECRPSLLLDFLTGRTQSLRLFTRRGFIVAQRNMGGQISVESFISENSTKSRREMIDERNRWQRGVEDVEINPEDNLPQVSSGNRPSTIELPERNNWDNGRGFSDRRATAKEMRDIFGQ